MTTTETAPAPEFNWTTFEAALATELASYEPRKNQQDLAAAVKTAMEKFVHLVAQAGTGTGKSLGGVVPAIERTLLTGRSVVLATGTKVLQGQYVLKDLPMLVALIEKHFGFKITFAELKGRSNYLCMAKVAQGPDVELLPAILKELQENPEHNGDMERFAVTPELDGRDLPKLTSTTDECPGAGRCPFGSQCFAVAASNRAKTAQLVVTNHAMLAIDAVLSRPAEEGEKPMHVMLPNYDHVIIDEAHEFEGYVTNALGAQMSEATFKNLIGEAQNFTHGEIDGSNCLISAQKMFDKLAELVPPRGDSTARLEERFLEPVRIHTEEIAAELRHMHQLVGLVETGGDETAQGHKARLKSKISALLNKVSILDPWNEDSAETDTLIGDVVRWVEREPAKHKGMQDRIKVGYSPLSVGNFLHERLWSHHQATLLSATLANGDDFSYIPRMLGLREYTAFDAGTPFDYANQARLFIPEGPSFDPTKGDGWQSNAIRMTDKLVRASGGRALLLFTSRKSMEATYKALAQDFEDDGFPCYIQRTGTSTDYLMTMKAEEPESVVFGLKSLMQGVSVEGDALQLVVLDKCPFPVPSEVVFQARADALQAWVKATYHLTDKDAKWHPKGAFNGMSIPMMLLVLLQSFGRLIRNKQDQGLMAVLDSRLHPRTGRNYSKTAMRALPPATQLATDREAVAYLKGLHS